MTQLDRWRWRCKRIEARLAPAASTRLPQHEAGCHFYRSDRLDALTHLLEQQFHRSIAHLEKGNVDAGQGWFLYSTFRPVIKPMMATSCGIFRPASASACIAPKADSSLLASTAVNAAPEAMTWRMAV